jgi:hypothetical protein
MPIDSMLAIGSVHQHLIKSKLRTLAGLMIESVRQYVCVCARVCLSCVTDPSASALPERVAVSTLLLTYCMHLAQIG